MQLPFLRACLKNAFALQLGLQTSMTYYYIKILKRATRRSEEKESILLSSRYVLFRSRKRLCLFIIARPERVVNCRKDNNARFNGSHEVNYVSSHFAVTGKKMNECVGEFAWYFNRCIRALPVSLPFSHKQYGRAEL